MMCEFINRTMNFSCVMKILFCMLLIGWSEAGIEFPNLRTVDHGDGATSYQNVEMDNGLSIPTKTINRRYIYPKNKIHEFHYDFSPPASVVSLFNDYGTNNDDHRFFASSNDESYIQNDIEQLETKNIAEPSGCYDNYNPEYDYEYQQ